jgi:hypothetical protein
MLKGIFDVCGFYAGIFYVERVISLCLITQLLCPRSGERQTLVNLFESVVPDSVSGRYTLTRNR